jgi:hypothetical protein
MPGTRNRGATDNGNQEEVHQEAKKGAKRSPKRKASRRKRATKSTSAI